MSKRNYTSFLNVFDDYPEKMTSKQVYERFKISNGREVKLRTVHSTLSRMIRDGIVKKDRHRFYLDNHIDES